MIKEKLFEFDNLINPYGEKVTLVGATKTQSVEVIKQAIQSGLKDIGENKAQEFRDKYPLLPKVNYHFFGRLQANKVKYLIGKCCLIQSVDNEKLASEISRQSKNANLTTNILLEVNLGEEQKGGIPFDELEKVYETVKKFDNIKILGLMAVLPNIENKKYIEKLCLLLREKYDIMRKEDNKFCILSMGMSNDYQLAVKCGSNMIRIGSKIFGERIYKEND